jgi:tetratricopeptide (TPR) repeat protein
MKSEEQLFKMAKDAIEQGDNAAAREHLVRLLQFDRSNPQYWLWMSAVVETLKEREFCLREVLKLDRKNPTAIHGLRILGYAIESPEMPPGYDPLKRDWKTSLEIEKEVEQKKLKRKPRTSSWVMLGMLVFSISALVFFLVESNRYRPDTSPILKFSLTPPYSATLTGTPTSFTTGAPPLWTLLEATYTPTPIYAATPHKLSEAYMAAMRAYTKGDWVNALVFFQQVVDAEPDSADIWYHIGEVYRFQGMLKAADTAYGNSLKSNAVFAPAYLGKARVSMSSAPPDHKHAAQYLQKALELDPGLSEALSALAELQLSEGDAVAALNSLSQYEEQFPLSAQVELLRARAYLVSGNAKEALSAAQHANRLDITLIEAYKLIAAAMQNNERVADSIEPLETYLTYETNDAEALAMMSLALVEEGNLEEALLYAERALDIDHRSVPALIARGRVLFEQGAYVEAAETLDSAIEIQETSFEANILKSQVQLTRKLNDSAIEFSRRAYELAKNDRQKATALYWRARAYAAKKQNDSARSDLKALLELPVENLPADLREEAQKLLHQLSAATPTPTPTISKTRTTTRTPSASASPASSQSATFSPTRTPTPSPAGSSAQTSSPTPRR